MLRGLKPGATAVAPPSGQPSEDRPRARDPYLEILEQLWDKAPDWKKKDIAAQIRLAVEEYQREQEWLTSPRSDEQRRMSQPKDEGL